MLGGLLLAPLIVHILAEHLMYAGGLLLAPVLIVHILAEHLMYAWWVITCPFSNSAHISRTSDVCLVGYYLPLF